MHAVVARAAGEPVHQVGAGGHVGAGGARIVETARQQLGIGQRGVVGKHDAVDRVAGSETVDAHGGAAGTDLHHESAVLSEFDVRRRDAGAEHHAVRCRAAKSVCFCTRVGDAVGATAQADNVGVVAAAARQRVIAPAAFEACPRESGIQRVVGAAPEQRLV